MNPEKLIFEQKTQKTEKAENEKEKVKKMDNFFEQFKKPYGLDDIRTIQRSCVAFEKYRKEKGAEFVLDNKNFYQLLTMGTFSEDAIPETARKLEKESEVDSKDYEKLMLDFYRVWKENILYNQEAVLRDRPWLKATIEELSRRPEPKNLDDLRDLCRSPLINSSSAVSYQEGLDTDKK